VHFEFLHPYYFLLLLPIICLYLCPLAAPKRHFVHLKLFKNAKKFINIEKLLFSLVLIFILCALASPITYEQKSPNHKKGRDLIIALDTSGSMGESGYDDEKPRERKFDSILKVLQNFIEHRYDDNIGVVAFGNFAFALSPLTYDRGSLNFVLKFLNVGIAGDNTAIGDGIMQSITLLEKSQTKNRVIILLSDGYQNSGTFSPKDAVTQAKQKSIKIYTIGIGKKRDFDETLLKKIAKESGGKFFAAQNITDMQNIYSTIDSLEPSPIRSEHYLNKTMLFDIPLTIALGLLIYLLLKRKKGLII